MLSVFLAAVLMLTGCVLSYRNGYNDGVRDTKRPNGICNDPTVPYELW